MKELRKLSAEEAELVRKRLRIRNEAQARVEQASRELGQAEDALGDVVKALELNEPRIHVDFGNGLKMDVTEDEPAEITLYRMDGTE